jgi:hypothetical protein
MIFQILFLPLVLILGTIMAVMLLFFAFSENPLLGLGGILIIGLLLYLAVKWEQVHVDREHPPEL